MAGLVERRAGFVNVGRAVVAFLLPEWRYTRVMIMPRRLVLLLLAAAAPALAQPAPEPTTALAQPASEPVPALAQPVPETAPAAPVEAPPPAPEAPPPPPPPRPATVKVRLMTAAGPITLELEKARAPITTANFLRYVDQKRLDGTSFYRALKFPADTPLGLVQGGVRGAIKRSLPPIAHEPTTKTGLTHDNGAISMGRTAPGTAQGDFFIILGNLPALDANPQAKGDKDGYAVFGHVVEGLDTVIKILGSPVSPTAGEGAMKGQMVAAPVALTSARRLP